MWTQPRACTQVKVRQSQIFITRSTSVVTICGVPGMANTEAKLALCPCKRNMQRSTKGFQMNASWSYLYTKRMIFKGVKV